MVPPAPCIAYGEHPDQVANLHLPAREGGPWPCVVLLHGGFWRTGWDRTLMTPLAFDLAGARDRGVERRVPARRAGGRRLARHAGGRRRRRRPADGRRRRRCGARRDLRPLGGRAPRALARGRARASRRACPARIPRVTPVAAVAQAGVCDLDRARRDDLGGGAVEGLLGPPDAEPVTLPRRPLRSRRSASRSSSSTAARTTSCPCRRAGPRLARPRRGARRARRRRPLRGDRAGESRLGCGRSTGSTSTSEAEAEGLRRSPSGPAASRCPCRLRPGTAARRRSSGRPGPA